MTTTVNSTVVKYRRLRRLTYFSRALRVMLFTRKFPRMFHALGNRQRFDSFVRLCFSLLPQRYPPVRRAQQHPSTCSPARLAAIQQGVDSRPRMAFPGVPLDFSRCSLPGRDK